MRTKFFLWLLLSPCVNAQFYYMLSDGELINNPEWIGLTSNFRIDPENHALQLYAPEEPGSSWIFTSSNTIEDALWLFSFKLGFNPSSNNYAIVYLASDACIPDDITSSLYLVIGGTADNISLWQQNKAGKKLLIEGEAKRLDMNIVEADVRVSREKGGRLVLEINMGEGWIEEGSYNNSEAFHSAWFGLSCYYTKTRSTRFWFSNFQITGKEFKDTIAPIITNFEVLNSHSINLEFSKPINQLIPENKHFVANPGNIQAMRIESGENNYSLKLIFKDKIPISDHPYLIISELKDIFNNQMPDTLINYSYEPAKVAEFEMTAQNKALLCFTRAINSETLIPKAFVWLGKGPAVQEIILKNDFCAEIIFTENLANCELMDIMLNSICSINGDTIASGPYPLFFCLVNRNDIVITELMTKPSPTVSLPDSEYIELYNRGNSPVNLKGFSLIIGNRNTTLKNYILFPGEYLLLVPSAKEQLWTGVNNKITLNPWPTLTITSGKIVLRDAHGRLITALSYDREMGDAGFKRNGGWALELIDPDNLSFNSDNWNYAKDLRGGTPGEPNSLLTNNPDFIPPEMQSLFISSDSCLTLEFSKAMDEKYFYPENFYTQAENLSIKLVKLEEEFLNLCELCFSKSIPTKKIFTIGFHETPLDISGNILEPPSELRFGIPENTDKEDVIINELLFDPPINGKDFVELFNRSDKIADLSTLYISKSNNLGIPERLIQLSDKKRPFFPGDYLVFTADKEWLLEYYQIPNKRAVIELNTLPDFVKNNGTVFLTDVHGQIIDCFSYNTDMHFPLLSQTRGVSLERIDAYISALDKNNWHSASSLSNYATPGMKNSQEKTKQNSNQEFGFIISPEIFTPNQDGIDDLLIINYNFPETGNCCTITIYDRAGQPVRHLANNEMAGPEGFFTWDGTNDNGSICPPGIYILLIRSFNLKGKVTELKKIAVLGTGSL